MSFFGSVFKHISKSMLKVTNEDHFFHVKQHFPTTVSKHLWFGLKELSKMLMTTFPLIQGLGRPQIIILNSCFSVQSVCQKWSVSPFTSFIKFYNWALGGKYHQFLSSWWFFATHLKNLLQSNRKSFPQLFLMNIPEIFDTTTLCYTHPPHRVAIFFG